VAWGFAGAFALLFVLSIATLRFAMAPGSSTYDLVAQTTRHGDLHEISGWLASVGDSAMRLQANSDGLTQEIASDSDPGVLDKALSEVARNMGMK